MKENDMSNELRDRIAETIYSNSDMDSSYEDIAAQAVIDLLGLRETTESLSNDMVKYETKWLKRDD